MHGMKLAAGLLLALLICWAGTGATVRGKLTQAPGNKPALTMAGGKLVFLDGDAETLSVLNDKRLAGMEIEAAGQFTGPNRFTVGPFHLQSFLVIKNGKKYEVTYWCNTCSIRTYTPGKCVCCQQETELDLREPDEKP